MAIKPPDPGEREKEEEALSLGPLAAAEKRLPERFFRHTSKGETTFFPWWEVQNFLAVEEKREKRERKGSLSFLACLVGASRNLTDWKRSIPLSILDRLPLRCRQKIDDPLFSFADLKERMVEERGDGLSSFRLHRSVQRRRRRH